MSQVQKKRKISQDEAFFEDDWLEAHPEVELENIKVLQKAEYQPDQTMSDYSPEDLAMSSAIEGFQPMKYSFRKSCRRNILPTRYARFCT